MSAGYYTTDELVTLGLNRFGNNVKISKKVTIAHPHLLSIGHNVRIDDYCVLLNEITIGNYVHIAPFTFLSGNASIVIEDFSSISARVTIFTESEDHSGEHMSNPMVPPEFTNPQRGKVHLKRHVVVGTGSTILPSVTVGEGSVVGAHSLVVLSLKSWGIYFGTPVKLLKPRKKKVLELEKKLALDFDN